MGVREVSIAEYWHAAVPLMRENWAETGFDFDFNPSGEMYARAEQAGVAFGIGAFDGDKLVGYSTAVVTPHPFNPDVVVCSSDAMFLLKPYRSGTLAGRLILHTERLARQRGAHRMLWHTRAGTSLAATMANHGYKPVDEVVMKEL